MGYIYKITNSITKKCYIGETKKTNPELRWNEHKSKIEKGIGCPALQDAVRKYGIDNFKFDILIICFDEDRYYYEKEYIKKYNSMSPNGYNLTPGGEGGGFHGKKHSESTIAKIKNSLKQLYENNPELRKISSERVKSLFKDEKYRIKISEGVLNSEKWKNSKKGNYKCRNQSEETKNKIKNSVKEYYKKNTKTIDINIEKHRSIMAMVKGVKIIQYDLHNNFIKEFVSIKEASRQTGIPCSTLGKAIRTTFHAGNFIWRKA